MSHCQLKTPEIITKFMHQLLYTSNKHNLTVLHLHCLLLNIFSALLRPQVNFMPLNYYISLSFYCYTKFSKNKKNSSVTASFQCLYNYTIYAFSTKK